MTFYLFKAKYILSLKLHQLLDYTMLFCYYRKLPLFGSETCTNWQSAATLLSAVIMAAKLVVIDKNTENKDILQIIDRLCILYITIQ